MVSVIPVVPLRVVVVVVVVVVVRSHRHIVLQINAVVVHGVNNFFQGRHFFREGATNDF
jgi:hypothetical protein